jgi:8-oxo-dGTP pyrophosphatase MutT (NUDIX family)
VKDMPIVSAGGVVWKTGDNGEIEVKLITTRGRHFGLPKGRLEAGESIEHAAIREVKEEAGVEATIETYLGVAEWKMRNGDIKTVHIYLMRLEIDGPVNDPDNEVLHAEWKPIDEAIRLVDFPPMRKMLIYAVKALNAEKANQCAHCFDRQAMFLDWCEECLIEAKINLERKHTKKALKK